MKKLTLLSLVGITSIALAQLAAGRGGGGGGGGFHGGGGFGGGGFGGGGFRGGGFGGGGGFRGGGFAHMSPGARFSFGARPVYGRPAFVRSGSRSIAPTARATTALNRQQGRGIANGNRTGQTSRSVARSTDQRPVSASGHIFARHDGNWQRGWDRRSAHFRDGHWWCYDGDAWIGLDDGFYPWDYYPYYAYDYYPYDYYPGYYADVEPEYYSAGVPASVDQRTDPNVAAVQTDLAKLGYYRGAIDGLFGRDTRDAVARYQSDQNVAITGTLTTQTLQSLGVKKVASN